MIKQEGRIIIENPLRILGVYSDTPKKEIMANLGKMRAFAKTGKTICFDSDFTSLLGPVNRALEAIEKANNDISLPKDKLQAGMFWFMQHTDNDKLAMESLKAGNADEAMTIIQKKGNYSGVVNMAVLALVLKRWDIAIYSYAYLLESPSRRGALIKAFTDTEDYFSEDDLVDFISTKLIQDFPSAHWVEQLQHENVELGEKTYPFKSRFEESKLLIRLSDKCINKVKYELESTLKKGSSISREDANANLDYVERTKDSYKDLLKELRLALGKSSDIYIKYADKVANQYLNCCINYYNNEKSNPNRARVILKYTRLAYRFAEGKTAKDRMKENLEIIEQACEDLIPELIENEFDAIDKMVMDYHDVSKTKDYTEHLGIIIEEAYKLIQIIKDKIGKYNKHYIDTSSNFVLFAIQEVRLKMKATSLYKTISGRFQYKSSLQWGRQILDLLAKFDKDDKCQLEYDIVFTQVIDGLNAMKPTNISTPKTTSNSTSSILNNKPNPTQKKININYSTAQKASSRVQKKDNSNKNPIFSSNDSDNKTILYFLILGGFVFLMILLFGRSGSSENKSKSTVNKEVVRNVFDTNDNYPKSSSSSYPTKNNQYSSNSSSSYNDVLNEDLSKYNFESDKNSQTESYATVHFNTGDRPYQSTYGRGIYDSESLNSLLIRNGSSTDAVVILEKLNGRKVRHVFIARDENFTMTKIPGGQYIVKSMQGTDWNPEKDNGSRNPKGGFMKYYSISRTESYDPLDYPEPSTGRYSQGEITLYKVQNGNMRTETISENDFF